MSVSCGNSSIFWALHGTKEGDLSPHFFWRTPHLMPEDVNVDDSDELVAAMARHLPEVVSQFLFGKADMQTYEAAIEKNTSRGYKPTFYIVSTNKEQIALLEKMIGSIPCRMYEMKADDFFTQSEGAYKGMGVDRLANLRGAMTVSGLPALVIDAGSALTYTATDSKGTIIGGGISPGISMRVRALNEFTDGLPLVDGEKEIHNIITAASKNSIPPSIFASSTKDAIVNSMLNEISSHVRSVATKWEKEVGKSSRKRSKSDDIKVNSEKHIMVTGGGCACIEMLLQKNSGGLIDSIAPENFKVKNVSGLIHFGVTWVVCKSSEKKIPKAHVAEDGARKKPKTKVNPETYVGKNIAKEFAEPDGDGDHIYRGVVASFEYYEDTPLYRIVYSDGDQEDIDIDVLTQLIDLYKSVGAKKPDPKTMPEYYIGKRIAKLFYEKQVYFGTIVKFEEGLFYVEYDDGDKEDFDAAELLTVIRFYEKKCDEDPTR